MGRSSGKLLRLMYWFVVCDGVLFHLDECAAIDECTLVVHSHRVRVARSVLGLSIVLSCVRVCFALASVRTQPMPSEGPFK